MKKSQLRKIIRESIKELIMEQVNGMHQSIGMEICDCQPSTASSCQTLVPNMNNSTVNRGWTCNGQMCQQSDIGNIFTYTGNLESSNVDFTSITFKLTTLSNPAPIGSYYPPFDMVSSSCPSSSGCDPSAWPNHSNWINTWTSLPNFSSSNPNQPCNMICNKLQIWNNNLSGAGPVQTNQLNCKIAEGQNQSQIHGCNC